MSCPLLSRRSGPHCKGVAGPPVPVETAAVTEFCEGSHGLCPVYRFLRSAGRFAHPADHDAWVKRRIPPGHVDPEQTRPQPPG